MSLKGELFIWSENKMAINHFPFIAFFITLSLLTLLAISYNLLQVWITAMIFNWRSHMLQLLKLNWLRNHCILKCNILQSYNDYLLSFEQTQSPVIYLKCGLLAWSLSYCCFPILTKFSNFKFLFPIIICSNYCVYGRLWIRPDVCPPTSQMVIF